MYLSLLLVDPCCRLVSTFQQSFQQLQNSYAENFFEQLLLRGKTWHDAL